MTKKTMKFIGLIFLAGIIVAGSVGAYMFFKPHRNVQSTDAFAELKVSDLVNEFTADAAKANAKYLASDGNSKVLIIEGRVSNISTNQAGEKVIVLKDEGAKVGVSATFTKKTNPDAANVKVGDVIKVKGAITAGNKYDPELDLYEHAILVQCDIIK
jgi:tRNA(Ile2) C34 agmatinyltransferase TiaS